MDTQNGGLETATPSKHGSCSYLCEISGVYLFLVGDFLFVDVPTHGIHPFGVEYCCFLHFSNHLLYKSGIKSHIIQQLGSKVVLSDEQMSNLTGPFI